LGITHPVSAQDIPNTRKIGPNSRLAKIHQRGPLAKAWRGGDATAMISSAINAGRARRRPCQNVEGVLDSGSLLQQGQELVID